MARNLIRNGGFERGNLNFWTAYDEQNFYVQNVNVHKGTWAGDVVCNGSDKAFIMPNDYIELVEGEMAYFELYAKVNAAMQAVIKMVYYDEGLNEVAEVEYPAETMSTSVFTQILIPVSGIHGARYVRPKIQAGLITFGRTLTIDNVLMYKFSPNEVMAMDIFMYEGIGLTGEGSFYSEWFLAGFFREVTLSLLVSSCAGAPSVLDVTLQSRLSMGTYGYDTPIATFETVSAAPTFQQIVLNEGLGSKVRIRGFVTGIATDVTYRVSGHFKR